MAYSEKVIDHAENPRNVGTLDKDDPNVGTGLVGAPAWKDSTGAKSVAWSWVRMRFATRSQVK